MDKKPQLPQRGDGSFWIGIFLGGLLGAFLVIIWGTEKGKKMADHLRDQGSDLWDKTKEQLEEKVEELQEKSEKLVKHGKELQKEITEKVVEVKDEVSQEALEKADATLGHIQKLQERGRNATADIRKRLFKNIPRKS